jgi:hypothetical protein
MASICVTSTRVTSVAEPVRSLTSPTKATVANQSPMYETSCAE